MDKPTDWPGVAHFLDELYKASEGMGEQFSGRKFTLDGHLLASVG